MPERPLLAIIPVGHTMETVKFIFLESPKPVAFDDMAKQLPQFTMDGEPERIDCSKNYSTGKYRSHVIVCACVCVNRTTDSVWGIT